MAEVPPRAIIFGCAGPILEEAEASFFAETNPLGFILFERNCVSPGQVRDLVRSLRATVNRGDAPILIDQEGGRVERLKPPNWRHAPPAGVFAELARNDLVRAESAVRINMRLIAAELYDLGVTVNCAPVLDIPLPSSDPIIGDRAFGDNPGMVTALGRAACDGLMAGGIIPVIKHLPGHGRATADSHKSMPVVDSPREVLAAVDFSPFRALSDCPWGMTAHVLYPAFDANQPATLSRTIIHDVIRGDLQFSGVLVSDDLGMNALSGPFADRASAALAAGCDLVLHCSGNMAEMTEVIAGVPSLTEETRERLIRAIGLVGAPTEIDRVAVIGHLNALLPAGAS